MDRIEIKSRVCKEAYVKLMMKLIYKRPATIFITLIGSAMLVFALLDIFNLMDAYEGFPTVPLILGTAAVVVLPLANYRVNSKNFDSNKRLQEEIEYSFEENLMSIKGESFDTTLTWDKAYKVTELSSWILLYQTKQVMNIIPKSAFSELELNKFRTLVLALPNIKKKLKRN